MKRESSENRPLNTSNGRGKRGKTVVMKRWWKRRMKESEMEKRK